MNIGTSLPQFIEQRALFIVTGIAEAHFYVAADSTIEELAEFHISRPRYSDHEGFFATRTKGKTIRSGSVYNNIKDKMHREFFQTLGAKLKIAVAQVQPTKVYVFAPQYAIAHVKNAIPSIARKHIIKEFPGNFAHERPARLLGMLEKEIVATRKRLGMVKSTRESRKILRKPRRAVQ